MSEFPTNFEGLEKQLYQLHAKADVLQLLSKQLEKDLTRSGLLEEPHFHTSDVSNWMTELSNILIKLENEKRQQLCYLIDLPETLFQNLGNSSDDNITLAELILYRELVKVHFQLSYR